MCQNLRKLHAIDSSKQKVITVEDIYEGTNVFASNLTPECTQLLKKYIEPFVDLEWPLSEEEFFIALLEN